MMEGPFIAEIAALLGEPARANIVAALMGGQAMTATELALTAGVAPSTASGHLAKLVEGKLLSIAPQGRHRYYRLASKRVAALLEALMAVAIDGPPRYRPRSIRDENLAAERTCYDHLAGRLGVALADNLSKRGFVLLEDEAGVMTSSGRRFLEDFGLDFRRIDARKRSACRACLDWSERRFHIGGALGAALAERCFHLGWIERRRDGRALTITPSGKSGFYDTFGIGEEVILPPRQVDRRSYC
jgi:DNA-binding transcriptional ArsR family regulator